MHTGRHLNTNSDKGSNAGLASRTNQQRPLLAHVTTPLISCTPHASFLPFLIIASLLPSRFWNSVLPSLRPSGTSDWGMTEKLNAVAWGGKRWGQ